MSAKCPKCHSSNTYKFGFRKVWKAGHKRIVQSHQCQNCGHQWREK